MKKALYILVPVIVVALGIAVYVSMNNTPTPAPVSPAPVAQPNTNTDTEDRETNDNTNQPGATINLNANINVGITPPATGPAVKSFTINGSNFAFAPNTITVKKGDTVKITFKNTSGFHDLVIDEFNAKTKQINGGAEETISFIATKTGSFEFYCSVGKHRDMGMKGTLIVQ